MLYSGKFRNNSPFISGERLDFIELQDAKLTKNKNVHRKAARVIFIFKGRLVRKDIT